MSRAIYSGKVLSYLCAHHRRTDRYSTALTIVALQCATIANVGSTTAHRKTGSCNVMNKRTYAKHSFGTPLCNRVCNVARACCKISWM